MMKRKILFVICAAWVAFNAAATGAVKTGPARNAPSVLNGETLESLAAGFEAPADEYKPHAWWHWLGTNYSKAGITKDLEAMKESGIGGVVIFNAPSWLDPAKNPWPEQTYRSPAYWDAVGHALAEARRLGMTVGIQNSPGWSTTGGPWITPENGMQAAAFSTTAVHGGSAVRIPLPNPKEGDVTAQYFRDVAVMAVPADGDAGGIIDISEHFANGILQWDAPQGEWTVYRFGYFPTMSRCHPAPEDVANTAFDVDKMDPSATALHWAAVLGPLKERFGEYVGDTFRHIWIDSYEAGCQNWSPNFREDFIRIKGYDPVRQIVLAYHRGDKILNDQNFGIRRPDEGFAPSTNRFLSDYAQVINRLFMDCWKLGKQLVNDAGFELCWEPYSSVGVQQFDTLEGLEVPDIPVTEFWVHSREVTAADMLARAAAGSDRRIVGAEAFTGMEATCTYTETPAMLKRPADMGFAQGVNLYFLHSWAHNPWPDSYQPGWNFAHYGTHFSRNQTWFRPGKAFFTYLARCQMLLQQGSFVSCGEEYLHRRTPEANLFFVRNAGEPAEKTITFPAEGDPEIWDAYAGVIRQPDGWRRCEGGTSLTLSLGRDESVFVVFPLHETTYRKVPVTEVADENSRILGGGWNVVFIPKTGGEPFRRSFDALSDFSRRDDPEIKYFSGTAVYEKRVDMARADLKPDRRVILDLGEVYDIAELEINGTGAGVLWMPPFRKDITQFLKSGRNVIKIYITNTWVNRLVGDEQYPEDFEWTDRNQGLRAMTGLPEWFTAGEPRPQKGRKAFVPWFYFDRHSPLSSAGLLGPVTLKFQRVEEKADCSENCN